MSADRLLPIEVSSPEGEVGGCVDELALRVEAVRKALEAAARDAEPYSDEERELRKLIEERDAACTRVGAAIARLLAAGGSIEARRPIPALPRPATDPDEMVTDEMITADRAPEVTRRLEAPVVATPPAPPTPSTEAPAQASAAKPTARVEPARPAPVRAPPAPTATLVALLQRGLGPSWEPPERDRRSVAGLLEQIGRPTRVRDPESARRTIDHVAFVTGDLDSWLRYPQATQQALVGLFSALARHVQDESPVDPSDVALKGIFSRLSRWSKLYRPGFVPGLSRSNAPNHGSWFADAEHWWKELNDGVAPRTASTDPPDGALRRLEEQVQAGVDPVALARAVQEAVDAGVSQSDARLVRLLLPRADDLALARGLKTLKSALRSLSKPALDEDESLDRPLPIPEDWPFRGLTVDKRAVVLGGDRRPRSAERMKDTFGFAEIEWEETNPRRVGALADRIRSGGVDLVILLRRFLGHSELEVVSVACRDATVPFCVVDTGYGVTQVRLAIERYLQVHVG